MAEIRKHVVKPMTIIGMEPLMLYIFVVCIIPADIVLLLVNFLVLPGIIAPFGFVGIILGSFGAGYLTHRYNNRNPDIAARLSERLNLWGLPLKRGVFARVKRTGWTGQREIYVP